MVCYTKQYIDTHLYSTVTGFHASYCIDYNIYTYKNARDSEQRRMGVFIDVRTIFYQCNILVHTRYVLH